MEPRRLEDLEAEARLAFQRLEWRVQRIGWGALGLFLAAAAAGLFGDGPLSATQAGGPGDPLWIEYDRFVRRGAASRIRVHLAPGAAAAGELRLRIERRYLDSVRIEQVTPQPQRVELGPDGCTYVFAAGAPGGSSVTFDIEPFSAGRHAGAIALPDGASARVAQFAYF
jgi:hypothetical protein